MGPRAGLTCGEEKNLLHLPGFELRTVQPVASRYSIPAPILYQWHGLCDAYLGVGGVEVGRSAVVC